MYCVSLIILFFILFVRTRLRCPSFLPIWKSTQESSFWLEAYIIRQVNISRLRILQRIFQIIFFHYSTIKSEPKTMQTFKKWNLRFLITHVIKHQTVQHSQPYIKRQAKKIYEPIKRRQGQYIRNQIFSLHQQQALICQHVKHISHKIKLHLTCIYWTLFFPFVDHKTHKKYRKMCSYQFHSFIFQYKCSWFFYAYIILNDNNFWMDPIFYSALLFFNLVWYNIK